MKIQVYNTDAKEDESIEVNLFKVNNEVDLKDMVSRYIKMYLANQHQGTSSTKTRGDVRGGGKKPWAQKHTGNARAGSIRSPIWVGGGVSHGPKPYQARLVLNKSIKSEIKKYLLNNLLQEGKISGINFNPNKPSTKTAGKFLFDLFGIESNSKKYFILRSEGEVLYKSFRNIKNVKVSDISGLNPFNLISADNLLIDINLIKQVFEESK